MGYKYYDRDEKRLQRKLIPLNIFVAILALVAAVSLMVTPLLTIDLDTMKSAITEVIGDAASGSGGSVSGDGESGANGSDQTLDAVVLALDGIDAKISISPLGMAKIAFAGENEKGEMFLDALLFETGLLENLMVSMVNITIVASAELADEAGIDYAELKNTLVKLDNAKTEEQFNATVNEYIGKIESQTNTTLEQEVKDELNDMCSEMYSGTVKALDGDASKFSLEAMVCVLISTGFDEQSGRVAVTDYNALIKGLLDETVSMPGGGSEGDTSNSMTDAIKALNEFAGLYGYGFYGILFFAAIWGILFLFAFFHTFAKNKRFTMWYAKLFGCYPCLVCGVLFKVAGLVIPSLMGETGAMIAPILGCITTMTWISGACYLLMWIVSIFWAFPIKRKIRKLRG